MSDVAGPMLLGAMSGLFRTGGNLAAQHQQQMWAERMTNEQWKREDTAVQRRAADMAAAGFNPVLATGAAAQSGPPVRADFPDPNLGAPLEGALQGLMMAKDIATKDVAVENARKQGKVLEQQAAGIELDNRLKEGVLQPSVDRAVAEAAFYTSTFDARVAREISETNQQFAQTLISQWEEKIKANEAAASKWMEVKAALEKKVLDKTVTKLEKEIILATAAADLQGQKVSDFKKLGLSPDASDRVMKAASLIIQILGIFVK